MLVPMVVGNGPLGVLQVAAVILLEIGVKGSPFTILISFNLLIEIVGNIPTVIRPTGRYSRSKSDMSVRFII